MKDPLASSNMAMENRLFIGDFLIEPPNSSGFPSLPRLMKPEATSKNADVMGLSGHFNLD